MTDEEAQKMLDELSKHFNQPVMPISVYCNALETWQRCWSEKVGREQDELFPGLKGPFGTPEYKAACNEIYETRNAYREGPKTGAQLRSTLSPTPRDSQLHELFRDELFVEQISKVFMGIMKSNLLARLLYGGQEVRTEMCQEHKGEWSGIEFPDQKCPHGCQLTGWLPKKDG